MRYNDTTEDVQKMIPGEHYRLIWDRSHIGKNIASVDAVIELISVELTDSDNLTSVRFKTIMLNNEAAGSYRLEIGKRTVWYVSEGSDGNYWEDL